MMKSVIALVVFAMGFSAYAEEKKSEGSTSVKIEDAAGTKNKVAGDIDEEITNAKLRAESGSKSKWSGSLTATYNGGSLSSPFDKNRPNTSDEATPPKVWLGGDLGIRYRMSKNDSINVGTGYQVIRPFHDGKKGNVSNPFVAQNHVQKLGGVQNVNVSTLTLSTDRDEREIGQLASLDVTNISMYDFGGSKLSLGVALEGYYAAFNKAKTDIVGSGKDAGPVGYAQRDAVLAAFPLIEYAVNDNLTLRTVFRPFTFNHQRIKGGTEDSGWSRSRWTQSIGVGYALTRDVYLYPNFQYDWYAWQGEDFNWFRQKVRDNSTVAMSATINMF